MRLISGLGQRWKRALGASFTITLLTAVAVAGIGFFGSEVLGAWKSGDSAQSALTSSGVLNFDAPAATVARNSDGSQVVKNWKYTQNPLIDNILLSNQLYFLSQVNRFFESSFLNFLNVVGQNNPSLQPFLQTVANQAIALYTAYADLLRLQQTIVNSQIPPSLRPPTTLPASPSL